MLVILFLVGLFSSTIGAICGVGGGVIIRPVLDLLQFFDVTVITFLSGCTVLSMTTYSVLKNFKSQNIGVGDNNIKLLAIGAAIGGLLGKESFSLLLRVVEAKEIVGAVQSATLSAITLSTFLYVFLKHRIKTLEVHSKGHSVIIGLVLGLISSFIGIGGGPINVVALNYFYSMDTKTAARNSIFIIFCSQAVNLTLSILTCSIPSVRLSFLIAMIIGGILGGIIGNYVYSKMNNAGVDKLLLILIIFISITGAFNTYKYLAMV